jgi:hypothetical protein
MYTKRQTKQPVPIFSLMRWGDGFLLQIFTGGETCVHTSEPDSKRKSMEWRLTTSPRKKKFQSALWPGKIEATVFWVKKGIILAKFLPVATTVKCDQFSETLKSLNAHLPLRRVRPTRKMSEVMSSMRPPGSAQVYTLLCPSDIWMDSFAATTLQSGPCTVRFLSFWSFERQPVRTSLRRWRGTAEGHAPVAVEEGEQLSVGGNTCSCSKVAGNCWQKWRLY